MSNTNELEALVVSLRQIEETLRDKALDALRDAYEVGDTASGREKELAKARRAVEKAIVTLEGLSA